MRCSLKNKRHRGIPTFNLNYANNIGHSLTTLLLRDIAKLRDEISKYSHDADLWKLQGEIKNTAGNLCLHLCGNLQHYVGHILGSSRYARNREQEFAARDMTKAALLQEIDNTHLAVKSTLEKLDDNVLESEYPEQVFSHPMTTGYFLIHLSGHLTYHLGQINYHRRILAS
ncbi:MAG: DinB family protein [Bacteroidia bacterium]|nr:DinB family protein [Bacteroidia bacterium]